MITAIILEDEKNVSRVMARLLKEKHPDIQVAGICFNVKEAEEMIKAFHPNLLFLDIELGKSQTCFDLLKKINPVNFGIIFTTAYSSFVIRLLKLSGIDFLLKPIDEKELETAIGKFKTRKNKIDDGKVDSLLTAWSNPGNQQNKVHLPVTGGYDSFTIADIIFCESVNSHTELVLSNRQKKITRLSLKECEEVLAPYHFYRIHRSYLVNLNHVKKYSGGKGGVSVMSNNINLNIAKSIKDKFLRKLKVEHSN